MKKELIEKMVTKYPDMFSGNKIYCGDGWFDIIWDICEEIEAMRPNILQIKESFGNLIFNASFTKDYSEQGWRIIHKAEEVAAEICETCGKKGIFRIKNSYRKVRCDKCHKKDMETKTM